MEASSEIDALVATTGKTGRELFELRLFRGETPRDFLTVGGMGHASSIALGLALEKPGLRVICLDGDGAALMHLGAMSLISALRPENYIHVLLNNRCHESVGGQATCAPLTDWRGLSASLGDVRHERIQTEDELRRALAALRMPGGPSLLEIAVVPGSRPDLGRPTLTPLQNKENFKRAILEG